MHFYLVHGRRRIHPTSIHIALRYTLHTKMTFVKKPLFGVLWQSEARAPTPLWDAPEAQGLHPCGRKFTPPRRSLRIPKTAAEPSLAPKRCQPVSVAVALLLLLTGSVFGADLDILRDRIHTDIVAKTDTSEASTFLASQNTNGSWADINYADQDASQWLPIIHLRRVRAIAAAYHHTLPRIVSKCRSAGGR